MAENCILRSIRSYRNDLSAYFWMLGWLSTKWRLRAASLLVALNALCLGAPTAVMAFGQGGIPAHCLTDEDQNAGAVHVHQDGTTHHHTGTKDDGDHSLKCCGLFSISAIAPAIVILLAPLQLASHPPVIAADDRTGRGSDRIDRPPRSRPSL